MRRVLLDENVPALLRTLIGGHDVRPVHAMGWAGLANGALIAIAEASGFDVLITADRNIRYQQNLTSRKIALIVLTTNVWMVIKAHPARIQNAIDAIQTGDYVTVSFPRAPLRRRPYTP